MFKHKRPVSCELFTTGVCNIDCNYCYIPKVVEMKNVHKAIIAKIEDGSYIKEMYDLFGDQLEHLGFWGTEPSLTLPYIQKKLPLIFSTFPKLKNIGWSSNFITLPTATLNFINALPKNKNIKVRVQVSLDGPQEITDLNRHPGATEKIVKHMKIFLEDLVKMDIGDIEVEFASKPTWDGDNIKYYVSNKENLYKYYKFYDELMNLVNSYAKLKPSNIKSGFWPGFTLAVPGHYTVDDGKNFSNLLHMLYDIERENTINRIFKNAYGNLNTYETRFERIFRYGGELHNKPGMFTCSGGDSNFAYDERHSIHICHRSLFLNNAKYIDEVNKKDEMKKWGVSQFDEGTIDIVNKKYIVDIYNEEAIDRFAYVMSGYHDTWPLKLNYCFAMINELAKCGQIEERFLHDYEYKFAFSIFLNTCLSCPMENLLTTGSIHLQSMSLFRLFGNGAFSQILDQLSRKYKNIMRRVNIEQN